MKRTRLCYVVATELTVKAFLAAHIRAAALRHDVTVVANADPAALADLPARLIPVPIERRIAPFADLAALLRLVAVFRRERFDLVHSMTPKAGLLAAIAGAAAGVPLRIHTFTGQVWATRTGASRALLRSLDRVTAALDGGILADSASQRDFLVAEGVVDAGKARVLGHGSVNGVDADRFRPDAAARAAVRAAADIPEGEPLFVYVGRFARDKGLLDLAQAFAATASGRLLLVGPDEDGLAEELRAACGPAASRLHLQGATPEPQRFMAAADVFVLPSYREGFGSVVLEAAACGVPAVATRIYGLTDAIVDGETGLLVPPRDPRALAEAMGRLAADAGLRASMGAAARARALRDFRSADLTRAMLAYYDELMGAGPDA